MIEREVAINAGDMGTLDWAGAATSCLCALNCALAPLAVGMLPTIGPGMTAVEGVEMTLLGVSAALGTISIGPSSFRHGSGRALAVLAAGLGLIGLGRFAEIRDAETLGTVAMVSGGLAIAASHLLNRRLCRACASCGRVAPGRGGRR